MLVINREFFIEDEDILEFFKSSVILQVFDDESKKLSKIYCDYIDEIFWLDQELTEEIADKINPHVIPVVYVDSMSGGDMMQLNFSVIINQDDIKLKTKENLLFEDLCYNKFKNVKPLLDRILSN